MHRFGFPGIGSRQDFDHLRLCFPENRIEIAFAPTTPSSATAAAAPAAMLRITFVIAVFTLLTGPTVLGDELNRLPSRFLD